MSRTNYVFIDFENVQETELDRIANKPVKVALILGQRHKRLPIKLVKLIQEYAAQVRLVETGLDGKNALDFVLACEIGAESEKDRSGYFHVLSRDKGFDAMIEHLKTKCVFAARHTALSEIPILMNAIERTKLLASRFKSNATNRPKKRETLESHIRALFGKALTQKELEDTVQGLITQKIIALSNKGDVAYQN